MPDAIRPPLYAIAFFKDGETRHKVFNLSAAQAAKIISERPDDEVVQIVKSYTIFSSSVRQWKKDGPL